MTLEQRLEAVEKVLADLTLQQKTTAELSSLMREVAIETIRKSQRPGGLLSNQKEKAAEDKAAVFNLNSKKVFIETSYIKEGSISMNVNAKAILQNSIAAHSEACQ